MNLDTQTQADSAAPHRGWQAIRSDWSDDEVSDLMMSIHSEWPADLYSSR
mgnify:CR=1 FL=1